MPFRSRNAYYLRVSKTTLVPLYLYLDEKHTEWMSDIILQHVLADLRPLIVPKLQAEWDIHFGSGSSVNNKKGSVDVHRGDIYQFAFFFRQTEPHSVILKTRTFVATSSLAESTHVVRKPVNALPIPRTKQNKRARASSQKSLDSSGHIARKKMKINTKGKARQEIDSDEEELFDPESSEDNMDECLPPSRTRQSRRTTRVAAGGYREDGSDLEDEDSYQPVSAATPGQREVTAINVDADPDVKHEEEEATLSDAPLGNSEIETEMQVDTEPPGHSMDLEVEEEEEKPKPLLRLQYKGFHILGRCLCVVAEPYPPIRAVSVASPRRLNLVRQSSIAAPNSMGSAPSQRARTPLFFPEDREESMPPSASARDALRSSIPLFNDTPQVGSLDEEDMETITEDDFLNFSQVLNASGDSRTAIADEDDEMDGAVLFGDADEVRELS
ncbi:hypothetical protein CONPUDRAFT_164749 [Coniophora puteana RWD-64-598 SS2]|uniref:Uncharacterized protein n=1 Tax=Coniophora puteana (strain RWD-64-598) TaxID=741705 RepID=A0A5M3MSG4_CONPW|nr:uncharacterized protein CONPUDRAFT_164749 [Coniophora puteana RWD-64-598 SS2]EIW82102.1 hypothetical protein CONPUDRAFT_164749 [Coniophora puteana RWD-64-598 SS2]